MMPSIRGNLGYMVGCIMMGKDKVFIWSKSTCENNFLPFFHSSFPLPSLLPPSFPLFLSPPFFLPFIISSHFFLPFLPSIEQMCSGVCQVLFVLSLHETFVPFLSRQVQVYATSKHFCTVLPAPAPFLLIN